MGSLYHCSVCRLSGHNRATCPTLAPEREALAKVRVAWRALVVEAKARFAPDEARSFLATFHESLPPDAPAQRLPLIEAARIELAAKGAT